MANYGHIIFFSLVGGVFSLVGGFLLLRNKNTANALAKYATPFAAGALLAAVFMDLLKEGITEADPAMVLSWAMFGVVVFFFAERFLHWFHHHHQDSGHANPDTGLIILGDTIHNALDGVAIAASFLISIPTGIVTTLAVAAHEIPQEIGDFGLLLSKGMKPARVIWANVLSALATTVAAVTTFAIGSADKLPLGMLLGISAGFLLYIAMSDIIPDIHEHSPKHKLFDWQPFMLLVGVVVVAVSIQISHKYIDAGHADPSNKSETTEANTPYELDVSSP